MAFVQAAKESIDIQEIKPSELNYVNQGLPNGANWTCVNLRSIQCNGSLQAPQEIHSVQFVEPIELGYPNQGQIGGANWILPMKEHPEAYLIDAITIDVTGEVDRKVNAFGTLKVGFELEVDPRSFGFNHSHVHIGVKLAEDLMYGYQSVQKQIAEMKPSHKTWVTAEFPVNGTALLGGKIYFQLMDKTAEVPKGGLKLSKGKG